MQFPITIGLHRSRFLDTAIMLAALLASSALLNFPATLAVKIGAIVGVNWIAIFAGSRLAPRYSAIRLEASGCISACRHHSDSFETLTLLPGATVHHWLTVIRLQNGHGQVETVIATVDSLKPENFRRLRVFLRWRADFSEPGDDA